jgi:hypothetical protein
VRHLASTDSKSGRHTVLWLACYITMNSCLFKLIHPVLFLLSVCKLSFYSFAVWILPSYLSIIFMLFSRHWETRSFDITVRERHSSEFLAPRKEFVCVRACLWFVGRPFLIYFNITNHLEMFKSVSRMYLITNLVNEKKRLYLENKLLIGLLIILLETVTKYSVRIRKVINTYKALVGKS